MKKIRINTGNIGLVFKNGSYKKVLTEGNYWLLPSEKVEVYDMAQQFSPSIALNILLKDETLAGMLILVEVKDNEIAIQFEEGNFKAVLGPGKHAFWKGLIARTFTKADLNKVDITENISLSVLKRQAFAPYLRVCNIDSFEKGILLVDNKFDRVLAPGEYFFWKSPVPIAVVKADLRQQQMEISGQEILTKDKASLRVNFFALYKVVDIEKALTDNRDYEKQLYILAQLALREFIGSLSLDELLEKKASVSQFVLEALKEKSGKLGVEVRDCGVRDIILPGEMKEIMNQVLMAQKQAQANVITRREETASTRSLLNTAKLMEENEMLFKLKEMEYVEKIADKINSISLSGGNQVIDQLRDIFAPGK